jgi:hypothetical protein
MSFEPAAPINVVVCDSCHGSGCDVCDHLGVYALKDDQPIGFKLPDFIDLKTRKYFKNIFIIKRVVLLSVVAIILMTIYALSR